MKHTLLAAVGFAALLSVPTMASAQDTGWYVRGNMGYGAFADTDLTGDMPGDVEAEGNAAGSVGVGYALGNNWRVELDGNQMWNDMGAIAQVDASFASLRTTGLMLNAIYDFEDFGRWEPYVGAGLGYVKGKLSAESHDFANGLTAIDSPVCGDICRVEDDAASLGWNILAGLGYNINENLVWDTKYTYTDIGEMDFDGIRQTVGSVALSSISVAAEDLASHTLMTGFRYKFGAKAAPVVAKIPVEPTPPTAVKVTCWDGSMADNFDVCPVEAKPQATVVCYDGTVVFDQLSCPTPPAPPVVEEIPVQASICDQGDVPFVVYFEWDKSRLTEQAQAVIDQASTYTQQCGVAGVTIEGHTDTSGSSAYNINLSKRRASTVGSALMAKGVDAASINKSGMGENGLAVQTNDGVREPLNRRSEVIIRLVPSNSF